ncbi:TIGR03086 family metal-binding protein [Nocardia iowensis]|uniref:TIGR03086 family protein n=1 Tax=Nocardia iowensis TaxID=204891 RepID=A0ABX8RSI6_NOCIO|nr:TIGR03086 family metal-binding protein [Nocardia iowensis]QXN91847.1 TIGR03086 family protein [Nocardia iowensis]
MIDLKPACETMIYLLTGTSDDQLTRPTPCAEYTVADLIDHIDEVAQGFAAIARKDTGEPDGTVAEATPEHSAEGRRLIAARVRTLGQAWDDQAAWHGDTALTADVVLTNETWGKIALTEMVVHGWDLAVATDRSCTLPAATLRACLAHVIEFIPNAPVPELWGSAVETSDDAGLIERIVAVTGRNPRWADAAIRG